MLSNECQRFLLCIVKIQTKLLKTVQSKKDVVQEDVAKVIYEFKEKSYLVFQSEWLKTVQSKKDAVKEDAAGVIHEFKESIRNKKVTTKQKL